jgi:hypothetical protein
MYNQQDIPPATMNWVMRQARNELNAHLCEVDFYEQNEKDWPADARAIAAECRTVAAAATSDAEKGAWFALAIEFEDTI